MAKKLMIKNISIGLLAGVIFEQALCYDWLPIYLKAIMVLLVALIVCGVVDTIDDKLSRWGDMGVEENLLLQYAGLNPDEYRVHHNTRRYLHVIKHGSKAKDALIINKTTGGIVKNGYHRKHSEH